MQRHVVGIAAVKNGYFGSSVAPTGHLESPITNVYVWAALLTAGVACFTRRGWLAIVAGVAVIVVIRLLGA